MQTKVEVLIVGGGIAGLSCAYELKKHGVDALLIEAKNRLGGRIRSERCGRFLIEHGPHTFLSKADALFTLSNELGLNEKLLCSYPSAANRYLALHKKAHKVPANLRSFIQTPLLSVAAKIRLLFEPWAQKNSSADISVLDFFRRRLGDEAGSLFAHAFVAGVYAGRPDCLSAAAALPMLWSFEKEAGSILKGMIKAKRKAQKNLITNRTIAPKKGLYSFENGLETLCRALTDAIKGHYETCNAALNIRMCNQNEGYIVESNTGMIYAKKLVLAVPPHLAGSLSQDIAPKISKLLQQIPLASVAGVYLGYDDRQKGIPDAFGCLAPLEPTVNSLGILFPSRIFPYRSHNVESGHKHAQKGDLVTAYLGGTVNPEILTEKSDEKLKKALQDDLALLFGVNDQPSWYRVERWSKAIPQFDMNHTKRVRIIKDGLSKQPTLKLVGNYLDGVGIPEASISGKKAAMEIIEDL